MPEIKERLNRLKALGDKLKGQAEGLKGPEGDQLKKRLKQQGIKIGVGAGTSIAGVVIALIAALYVLYVVILAVDTGLQRPWLSALIVVGGTLLLGGVAIAVGATVARSGATGMPKAVEEAAQPMKKTGEEIKSEAEELQKLTKEEAEERRKQVLELIETIKSNVQVIAPAAAIGLVVLWRINRRMKVRKARKLAFKILDKYRQKIAREGGDVMFSTLDLFEEDED